jgi:hypothetical protein
MMPMVGAPGFLGGRAAGRVGVDLLNGAALAVPMFQMQRAERRLQKQSGTVEEKVVGRAKRFARSDLNSPKWNLATALFG